MDGRISRSACQNSIVLCIFSDEEMPISIINNVNAIANTPSQKASRRALGFFSAIRFQSFRERDGVQLAGADRSTVGETETDVRPMIDVST